MQELAESEEIDIEEEEPNNQPSYEENKVDYAINIYSSDEESDVQISDSDIILDSEL